MILYYFLRMHFVSILRRFYFHTDGKTIVHYLCMLRELTPIISRNLLPVVAK